MGNDERDIDVTRRDLGALLGVLGGAAGLAALANCSPGQNGSSEPSATTSLPWTTADGGVNGTNFQWVDTIRGVGTSHPGTNLYNLSGSDSSGSSSPVVVVGGYWTPGDGGGGVFYWSNTPITDNGGTFIVPLPSGGDGGTGSSGPGWVRVYSGPQNARWFGLDHAIRHGEPMCHDRRSRSWWLYLIYLQFGAFHQPWSRRYDCGLHSGAWRYVGCRAK